MFQFILPCLIVAESWCYGRHGRVTSKLEGGVRRIRKGAGEKMKGFSKKTPKKRKEWDREELGAALEVDSPEKSTI